MKSLHFILAVLFAAASLFIGHTLADDGGSGESPIFQIVCRQIADRNTSAAVAALNRQLERHAGKIVSVSSPALSVAPSIRGAGYIDMTICVTIAAPKSFFREIGD